MDASSGSGWLLAAVLLLPEACGLWTGAGPGCRPLDEPRALADSIRESSGVAISARNPDLFWTTNDSGEPNVYAVDAEGRIHGFVRLLRTVEWDREDLSLARCGHEHCLYAADVGDNYAERDTLFVYRLREPDPTRPDTVRPETLPLRLPDGPRNVEAIFVLPGERLHLVSKGRRHPVSVYRYPGRLRPDTLVTLEEIQVLGEGTRRLPDRITGGAATRDGRLVALRTYESLVFHRVVGDTLAPLEGGTVNLRTLREGQGEAVAVDDGGRVVLTSEAGPLGGRGSIVVLQCELPELPGVDRSEGGG